MGKHLLHQVFPTTSSKLTAWSSNPSFRATVRWKFAKYTDPRSVIENQRVRHMKAMAMSIFSILCCIFALTHNAAGTLQLDITPTNIFPSVTAALDLNCTFSYVGLSNFSGIISLIVSKADLGSVEQPNFAEVLSLNVYSSDHVTDFQHHNAIFSGHLGISGDSYISAHWSYPTSDEEGLYMCEAVGVDAVGHAVQASTTVLVTSQKPDLDQIINKLSELQQQVTSQTATINALQGQVATQNVTIDALRADLVRAQTNLTDMNAALQDELDKQAALFNNLFEKSAEYNGRYYLLSKQSNMANVSEAYCEYMNGYLAEVDDTAEHQFIRSFLYNYTYNVFVGGTDEEVEGQWVWRYSHRPVAYTDWDTNEPNTSPLHDCMFLYRSYDYKMSATTCSSILFFLCEVPTH